MRRRFMAILLPLGLAAGAVAMSGSPEAIAQASNLAMLGQLAPGEWHIRFRPDNRIERICVRNGREFIQLSHRQQPCSQFIVEDTADRVTIQYTCRGQGYGRTYIRRENNGLVQIESQGLVHGQPFALSAEARHTGPCA